MVAVDTNILVYTHRPEPNFHAAALRLVRQLCEGQAPRGIPVHCQFEFVAVATHARIWATPSSPALIERQIQAWTQSPSFQPIDESIETLEILTALVQRTRVLGRAVHDARIVAACLSAGVTALYSADRDFSRFVESKVENSLIRA
jgi:uncharacterized protein